VLIIFFQIKFFVLLQSTTCRIFTRDCLLLLYFTLIRSKLEYSCYVGFNYTYRHEKVRKSVSLRENLFLSHENFTYDDSLPRDQLHNSQERRRTYPDAVSAINIYTGLNNVRPFRKKLDTVFHFVRDSAVFSVTHSGVMSRHSCTLC
jgi:hypothetical protein